MKPDGSSPAGDRDPRPTSQGHERERRDTDPEMVNGPGAFAGILLLAAITMLLWALHIYSHSNDSSNGVAMASFALAIASVSMAIWSRYHRGITVALLHERPHFVCNSNATLIL